MASLAENSVVIAIRDWQWANRSLSGLAPQPYLPMAGHAEKKLGDGVVALGDRFFLLEVKSVREKIPSEWKSDEKRKPKNAFTVLRNGLISRDPGHAIKKIAELRSYLFESLAGHMFAYWKPADAESPSSGNVVVEPYLLGISRLHGLQHEVAPLPKPLDEPKLIRSASVLAKFSTGISLTQLDADDQGSIDYLKADPFSLGMLVSASARIIYTDQDGAGAEYEAWSHVGFDVSTLNEYVKSMCIGSNPEVNIVLLSTGGLCAHATTTHDLAKFVGLLANSADAYVAVGPPRKAESAYAAFGTSPPRKSLRAKI